MDARRVLVAVTALNVALFAFSLYQSTVAQAQGGESNPTHIQLLAERSATSILLRNKDGRESVIRP